ncbi:MAG: hypothetical protein WC475_00990 [Candidatus Paceibacterota bacterium]
MFYWLLGILVLTEGASFFAKRRSFVFKKLFIGAIILVFGLLVFQALAQYQVWSGNALSRYLIPPYQSIAYFLKYSFTHFFENYLISLIAGILFLWLADSLNNRHQKRFFEEGEPYLGALAVFVMGQPLWLVYFIAVMSFGVLGTIFLKFRAKTRNSRFPFYYFWIPVAIIIMIIDKVWPRL